MTDRAYIPFPARLAATLACLMRQEERDRLRRDKAPAATVIGRFAFDHLDFHALGGSDSWWNLDPKLIPVHQEKTAKIDIPAIAKVKRLRKKEAAHQAKLAGEPALERATRKLPSRSFDKGHRPLRSGNNLRRKAE
jgi:hypothetical protein